MLDPIDEVDKLSLSVLTRMMPFSFDLGTDIRMIKLNEHFREDIKIS